VSLYGFSYGSYTVMMSASATSVFARKSAITISREWCVLYWIIVRGLLFIKSCSVVGGLGFGWLLYRFSKPVEIFTESQRGV
jgi:hypothetical protein